MLLAAAKRRSEGCHTPSTISSGLGGLVLNGGKLCPQKDQTQRGVDILTLIYIYIYIYLHHHICMYVTPPPPRPHPPPPIFLPVWWVLTTGYRRCALQNCMRIGMAATTNKCFPVLFASPLSSTVKQHLPYMQTVRTNIQLC